MLHRIAAAIRNFFAHLDYALRDPYDVESNAAAAAALAKPAAPAIAPSEARPAGAQESDRNAALSAAAKLVKDRSVQGYVPDHGCFSCFDRIEKAILGLKR